MFKLPLSRQRVGRRGGSCAVYSMSHPAGPRPPISPMGRLRRHVTRPSSITRSIMAAPERKRQAIYGNRARPPPFSEKFRASTGYLTGRLWQVLRMLLTLTLHLFVLSEKMVEPPPSTKAMGTVHDLRHGASNLQVYIT